MKHALYLIADRLLRRFGYRLVRHPRVLNNAQNAGLVIALPHAIAYHAIRKQQVQQPMNVLQVGAYETGEDVDILSTIRACHDYRVILIDPQPVAIGRLKARYGTDARIQILQAALGQVDSRKEFYYVDNHDNVLPPWTEQLASFSRNHIERCGSSVPLLASRIMKTEVDVVTSLTVLERFGMKSLDVLICDTEGHDYEILKAFPFEAVRPSIVQFEHAHLPRKDREAAFALLVSHGYKLAIHDRDTLAILAP